MWLNPKARVVLSLVASTFFTLVTASANAALIRYTVTDSTVYGNFDNSTPPSQRMDIIPGASLTGSFIYESNTLDITEASLSINGVDLSFDGTYDETLSIGPSSATFNTSSRGLVTNAPLLSLSFAPFLPFGSVSVLEPVSLAVSFPIDPPVFFYSTLNIITANSGMGGIDSLARFQLSGTLTPTLVPVPAPASAPLFAMGLLAGVLLLRWKRRDLTS